MPTRRTRLWMLSIVFLAEWLYFSSRIIGMLPLVNGSKTKSNDLHVSKITLDLMPDWSNTRDAGQAAYDCAHTLYQFIQDEASHISTHQTVNTSAAKTVASSDPYAEIKKLKELLDMDIISKEEFEKKEILGPWPNIRLYKSHVKIHMAFCWHLNIHQGIFLQRILIHMTETSSDSFQSMIPRTNKKI